VRARIEAACLRAGRDPGSVRLLAVTKGRSAAEVRDLIAAGHRTLGENRVQDWRAMATELADPTLHWHLVGHLQRNKVRYARPFELIHSLDSERLALALEAEGERHGHVFRTLLQVNLSGESTKYGVPGEDAAPLLARLEPLEHVTVEGLMTMAPFDDDVERARARARPVFRGARALADALGLEELSMGMSGDFEVAVEEGATLVRIGSTLFEGGHRTGARA
jgi:PLP dependent protein